MSNTFMRVCDVAKELEISTSCAYKIIQRLNSELTKQGYLTISGRVSKQYFSEKFYNNEQKERQG